MAVEVVMPKLGNSVESCLIVEWLVSKGQHVKAGDVLCSVETDKSTLEVESEHEGTVLALLYEAGDDVPVLKPMLILGDENEDVSAMIPSAEADAGIDQVNELPVQEENKLPERVSEPKFVSDKAKSSSNEEGFIAISPRARKLAQDKSVDYSNIHGSGPEGRIIENDILSFINAHPSISPAVAATGGQVGDSGSGIGGRPRPGETGISLESSGAKSYATEVEEVVELTPSGIRKVIGSRMMESLSSTAQFTLNSSASASGIMKLRKQFKSSDENLGLQGITLGDMVVLAVSRILTRYPEINAEFKNGTIYQYRDVHLGIAVDTPRGLMVPVIRNANKKSLKQISDELKKLANECRTGQISPDLLTGASFTISNLGAYGIESFTPVINAPQVAILGVCNIQQKPVLRNNETVFEPHLGLSLTIDHQVVDGAPAAKFLKEFISFLENFELVTAL